MTIITILDLICQNLSNVMSVKILRWILEKYVILAWIRWRKLDLTLKILHNGAAIAQLMQIRSNMSTQFLARPKLSVSAKLALSNKPVLASKDVMEVLLQVVQSVMLVLTLVKSAEQLFNLCLANVIGRNISNYIIHTHTFFSFTSHVFLNLKAFLNFQMLCYNC